MRVSTLSFGCSGFLLASVLGASCFMSSLGGWNLGLALLSSSCILWLKPSGSSSVRVCVWVYPCTHLPLHTCMHFVWRKKLAPTFPSHGCEATGWCNCLPRMPSGEDEWGAVGWPGLVGSFMNERDEPLRYPASQWWTSSHGYSNQELPLAPLHKIILWGKGR